MTTILPQDANGNPIPALTLNAGGGQSITTSATSARNTTAFDSLSTRIISLFATEDVYVSLGDLTVTATPSDHFFPKGIYYDIAIGDSTHIAVLQATTPGTLYISEKS